MLKCALQNNYAHQWSSVIYWEESLVSGLAAGASPVTFILQGHAEFLSLLKLPGPK